MLKKVFNNHISRLNWLCVKQTRPSTRFHRISTFYNNGLTAGMNLPYPISPFCRSSSCPAQIFISNSIKRGELAIKRPARWGSFSKITKWPESSGTFNSQSPLFMLFLCNIMFAWISFVLPGRRRQTRSV